MPYIPRTQTITRRTIKRVETRMNGLGFVDPVSLSFLATSGDSSFKAIIDWITGKTGELKIQATQFAENAVKAMYGLDPDCRMPTPGIPIVPMAQPPRFCVASIAGMIERCRLADASSSLTMLKNRFTTEMNSGSQMAPYVKRWYDEYGRNDMSNLEQLITNARATCGIGGGGPIITPTPVPVPGGGYTCPQNYRYNPTMERCDYVLPGVETGMSSTTMLMIFGAAALFMFAMKR